MTANINSQQIQYGEKKKSVISRIQICHPLKIFLLSVLSDKGSVGFEIFIGGNIRPMKVSGQFPL